MSQEREQSESKSLGLSLFKGSPQSAELALYQGTLDPEEKAIVLNTRVVQLIEDTPEASSGSIYSLVRILGDEQRIGISRYRSDAVSDLTNENLIGVINGLSSEGQPSLPLSSALQRIREASHEVLAKEFGIRVTPRKDPVSEDLEDEILSEFSERLIDDNADPFERRRLIKQFENMITPEGLKKVIQNPESLAALLRSENEFSDEVLAGIISLKRRALERKELS